MGHCQWVDSQERRTVPAKTKRTAQGPTPAAPTQAYSRSAAKPANTAPLEQHSGSIRLRALRERPAALGTPVLRSDQRPFRESGNCLLGVGGMAAAVACRAIAQFVVIETALANQSRLVTDFHPKAAQNLGSWHSRARSDRSHWSAC